MGVVTIQKVGPIPWFGDFRSSANLELLSVVIFCYVLENSLVSPATPKGKIIIISRVFTESGILEKIWKSAN